MSVQNYTIQSARYLELSGGRIVMLAKALRKSDDLEVRILFFKNKEGAITDVGLSFEAFEALRGLMLDPNAGDSGTLAVLGEKETVLQWQLVEDTKAFYTDRNDNSIVQAT